MPLNDKELDEKARRDAIQKADDLFTANKHEEVCEVLSEFKVLYKLRSCSNS